MAQKPPLKNKPNNTNVFAYKEPTTGDDCYELWLKRVNNAVVWRQNHWNGDKAWKKYRKLYMGNHWGSSTSPSDDVSSRQVRDEITVNLTGSTIRDTIGFLVKQHPKFNARPTRPEFVVSARIQGELLNLNWRLRKMQPQLKRAVLDGLINGHGIIKIGYEFEVDDTAQSQRKDGLIEYRDYVTKENPFIRRISPLQFVWDPDAPENDLASARWCAEIIFKPVSDVFANNQYDKKALDSIRSGAYSPIMVSTYRKEKMPTYSLSFNDEMEESDITRMVLYEIWDKKYDKYYVFAAGVPIPLREEESWPYDYLTRFPYEVFKYIDLPDEPFGFGIPALMEDQQHELNRSRTAMHEHRRRFNRKYLAVAGALTPEEMIKLETGGDGTIIEADQINAVVPIMDASLPQDAYNIDNVIKNDIRELTGSDELLRGGRLPGRTSATEIGARTSLMGNKIDDQVNGVDDFSLRIGDQLLSHLKANITQKDVIKLVGPSGEYWQVFDKQAISGEYDLELESTSKEPSDPNVEKQQAMQLFQMVFNSLPMLLKFQVQINPGELLKWIFSKFDEPEVSRFFPAMGILSGPINTTTEQSQQQGAPGQQSMTGPPVSQQPPGAAPPQTEQPQQGGQMGGLGALMSQLMGGAQGGQMPQAGNSGGQ